MKGIIVPLLDHIASAFDGDRHYIFNDNKGTKGNQGCMRLASCRGIFCFGFTVGLSPDYAVFSNMRGSQSWNVNWCLCVKRLWTLFELKLKEFSLCSSETDTGNPNQKHPQHVIFYTPLCSLFTLPGPQNTFTFTASVAPSTPRRHYPMRKYDQEIPMYALKRNVAVQL